MYLMRMWRSYFPKRRTDSWDEFCTFVKEHQCKYVTVVGEITAEITGYDSGANTYLAAAVTLTPQGFRFMYVEKTATVPSYAENFSAKTFEARKKLAKRLKEIAQSLSSIATTDTHIERSFEKQRFAA